MIHIIDNEIIKLELFGYFLYTINISGLMIGEKAVNYVQNYKACKNY